MRKEKEADGKLMLNSSVHFNIIFSFSHFLIQNENFDERERKKERGDKTRGVQQMMFEANSIQDCISQSLTTQRSKYKIFKEVRLLL